MDHTPLSKNAQEVAECYALIYPEAPTRSKAMKWINTARKATRGERGLKSDEISAAVVELVDAGVLSAGVTASRGVAARGPRAEIGMITALCESAIKRGGAELIVRGLENDAYHWQALTTQRWIWRR
jgi:hypothetical protein